MLLIKLKLYILLRINKLLFLIYKISKFFIIKDHKKMFMIDIFIN